MVTLTDEQELTTLEQVRCFPEGTKPVAFEFRGMDERILGSPRRSWENITHLEIPTLRRLVVARWKWFRFVSEYDFSIQSDTFRRRRGTSRKWDKRDVSL